MKAIFEGGRSWRVHSTGGVRVAVDPAWLDDVGWTDSYRYVFHPPRHLDHGAMPPVDAVVITGARPEQLDLQTLHELDRQVLVVVSPLLPAVAAEAIEVLGFVAIRGYVDHDVSVGDLVLRFVAPAPVSTAALPTAGLMVRETGCPSAFYLRGDGPCRADGVPSDEGSVFEVRHGGAERAPASDGDGLHLGSGVRHPAVDRSVFDGWVAQGSGPGAAAPCVVRAGDAWDIDVVVKPAAAAEWVSPGHEQELGELVLPLSARPRSDREGRDRHELVLDELPGLARDLTLYPPGGPRRAHWAQGTHDGLGPKTFLLTLIEGPAGTRCQYALDVTRSGFVPLYEAAETARDRFPCGLTLCFDDFVAILRGELYAADVFASSHVWSRDADPEDVRRTLADLFSVARPQLLRRVLISQANALVAGWAPAALLEVREPGGTS
ncbi:hypothetical protein ACLQ20_21865 [Micromonospora sp. DT46]|uniref:hypothetical protein n=1 Tax=Micromonospora sp. DT46 TaxID=3393435 RepID=UPI003CEEAC88